MKQPYHCDQILAKLCWSILYHERRSNGTLLTNSVLSYVRINYLTCIHLTCTAIRVRNFSLTIYCLCTLTVPHHLLLAFTQLITIWISASYTEWSVKLITRFTSSFLCCFVLIKHVASLIVWFFLFQKSRTRPVPMQTLSFPPI